ncbi:sulfatase-like hydrolase/transferase [Candidatus Poribacteria bacterium]|nr:sulfatase-like hydrolase/transferase [Candidatus Poribacteria bacterium]
MNQKPNIIFIMPDQLRADFLSCYGAEFIDTPHIDALGTQGVRYSRAYSEHPVCVPARVALMTGMNGLKTGVLDNGQFLRPDYRACGLATWPELLNAHDYYTIAVGKMHFYPWEKRLGFQRRIIAEDKLWGYIQDDYDHLLKTHGYTKTAFFDEPDYHKNFGALISPIPWEYSVDHFVGDETAQWIEAYNGDQPFAMMVGFPGPHNPYDPAPEYATFQPEDMPAPLPAVPENTKLMRPTRPSRSESSQKSWYATQNENSPTYEHYMLQRAYYAGLVKQIDHEVGCIVEALDQKGIRDNTVIIFASDHGDYLGDHGLSGKASYYEAACHVPMLVSHPEFQETRICEDLVTLTDVTATILGIAGCKIPAYMDAAPLPGLGIANEASRDAIMGLLHNGWMWFDGAWKLCKYAQGVHLFNLTDDPNEQHNLAYDPQAADVFHRMDAELTAEMMRLTTEAFFPQRTYTYSYSSSPDFGRVGWERTYPMPWDQIYPETDG